MLWFTRCTHVGNIQLWQNALRKTEKYRGCGARAARNSIRDSERLSQGDLRSDAKMLGIASRWETLVPWSKGAVNNSDSVVAEWVEVKSYKRFIKLFTKQFASLQLGRNPYRNVHLKKLFTMMWQVCYSITQENRFSWFAWFFYILKDYKIQIVHKNTTTLWTVHL